MNLVLIGPQGSGKGTQGRKLVTEFGLLAVEAGLILRKIAEQDTEDGRYARERLKTGKLFPDEFINNAVGQFLDGSEWKQGLLFDGFPRKENQVEYLDAYLKNKGEVIDLVIHLDIDEETSIARLSHRVTSKKTGKIYNMVTNPPPKDEKPEDLEVREDETPEAIRVRLEGYKQSTAPLLEIYRERGLVADVDARASIDVVYAKILVLLREKQLI